MSKNFSVDVAVIGAGIAGCHLAQLLAREGLRVALVDRKASPLAGPTWINAVPLWMFDEAGLAHPSGKEIFDINDRFIIRAPDKTARINIDHLGVADVHMGHLGRRLKDSFFKSANATFVQCAIKYSRFQGERLVEIVGTLTQNETVSIRASLFVDAAGIKGVLRKCHPRAKDLWPALTRDDACTAAQRTLEIKDRHGAMKFLESSQFAPGDILSDVGFMGGYSLFRVQLDKGLNHISILCGIRALREYRGASTVVTDFLANNDWIGRTITDGRGVIPLNAPYHTLSVPGLALLGDAACQVFAAHGSGIGIGLLAAKTLAQAIIDQQKAGRDLQAHAPLGYSQGFHRRYYQRLYFSEHFRRFTQNLSPHSTSRLIASGILGQALARQTLLQEEPSMSWSELRGLLGAAIKAPKIFLSLLPTFSRAARGKNLARCLAHAAH